MPHTAVTDAHSTAALRPERLPHPSEPLCRAQTQTPVHERIK